MERWSAKLERIVMFIKRNTRDGLRPIKRQKIGNANVRFVVLLGKFDFAGLNYLRKNQFDRMAIWCG